MTRMEDPPKTLNTHISRLYRMWSELLLLLWYSLNFFFDVRVNASLGGPPCQSLILHLGIIWRGTEKKTVALSLNHAWHVVTQGTNPGNRPPHPWREKTTRVVGAVHMSKRRADCVMRVARQSLINQSIKCIQLGNSLLAGPFTKVGC